MKHLFLFFLLSTSGFLANANVSTDTLANYFDLKTYSGDSDSVYLTNQRYYGLYIKDGCTTEDFGTTILTNTGCWKRVFNNLSPRFWEIGGDSPSNFIGTVKEEVDAINSAAIAAMNYGGDTIEINQMYLIDRSVFLLSGNTYLGMSDSVGFKRVNPPKVALKYSASEGDNKIIVENNEGFRTRQKINIANNIAYDSIAGFVSYTASVSAFLGGDTTIFLSGLPLQKPMEAGDTVSLFFPLMTPLFGLADSILIKNLVFDGNRAHYNLNYDWRVNVGINMPTSQGTVIEDCHFYNSTAENMFLCGAKVRNCSGSNFNGSALHFSCNTFDRPTEVLYNNFTAINEVGDSLMEHSEAALTFSAKVQNLRVAYNRLTELNENGIGIFQEDDKLNEITDNLFSTLKENIAYQAFYSQDSTNIVYNNKNLLNADSSLVDCFVSTPLIQNNMPCNANSSLANPLQLGDTVTISFDYLQVINSNENYVKCISPIYTSDFFQLIDIQMTTPEISTHHEWVFDDNNSICNGIVFDNGHQSGIDGNGNWGYEKCGEVDKCQALEFKFIVQTLPIDNSLVNCPLEGLEIFYDGDLETWEEIPLCTNQTVTYSTDQLGTPYLELDPTINALEISKEEVIHLFPNPATNQLHLQKINAQNASYQIINSLGRVVLEGVVKEKTIDINYLQEGFYWLILQNGERMTRAEFFKI